MKNKINRLLGSNFKKKYNVKLLSIIEENNIISMLINFNNEEAMFRIDTKNSLKDSVEAIKEIIANNIKFEKSK